MADVKECDRCLCVYKRNPIWNLDAKDQYPYAVEGYTLMNVTFTDKKDTNPYHRSDLCLKCLSQLLGQVLSQMKEKLL